MTENEKDVALTKAAEGADLAKQREAKSERSPVQIRSGPPSFLPANVSLAYRSL
jgi:hypothetical protein